MDWVRNKMPEDVPISNFTTDWNDGRAIGALVDSCAPGLYPDYSEPRAGMAKDAMDLAEQWLGVPQLIQPEEMTNPNVDELSMMTYLSQVCNFDEHIEILHNTTIKIETVKSVHTLL